MEDKKIVGKAHEQGSHYYNGKGGIDTVGIFNTLHIGNLFGESVNPMIPSGMFNIFKYLDRAGLKEGELYIKDIVKAKNYAEIMVKRLPLDFNSLIIKSPRYSLNELKKMKNWNEEKYTAMTLMFDAQFHELLEYLTKYVERLKDEQK